jgi:hypothetical protein
VTISGWRLGRLADALRDNELAAVSAAPKHYGELAPTKPYVASITITPIEKQ